MLPAAKCNDCQYRGQCVSEHMQVGGFEIVIFVLKIVLIIFMTVMAVA